MIPQSADVVIVGGGAMGLCTAYHLARRGCSRIVILDGDVYIGGQMSRLGVGGIRHQFSTALNIEMSLLSIQQYKDLSAETGYPIDFQWSGYAFVLTSEDHVQEFQHAVELQHRLGVATEWLSSEEVHWRFPMMSIEGVVAATFNIHDGQVDPRQVITSYATEIRRRGVTILTSLPVLSIQVEKGRIEHVITPEGPIATQIVVNAAGPWAAQVGRMVNEELPIRPVRHHLLVVGPAHEVPLVFPTIILPAENIGFRRTEMGLMAGVTLWTQRTSSLEQAEVVDATVEPRIHNAITKCFPSLRTASIKWCGGGFYDVTPDFNPILGRVPAVEGFYCIAGFSGHGFSHAPACGLLLCEEILDGKAHTLEIGHLGLERFGQDKVSTERHIL